MARKAMAQMNEREPGAAQTPIRVRPATEEDLNGKPSNGKGGRIAKLKSEESLYGLENKQTIACNGSYIINYI